jgi:AraC-like DNA-binding protein
MDYREHKPTLALRDHVECFWFVTSDYPATTFTAERVLPDGCLEWIFHLGAPFDRLLPNNQWERQPKSFLVGELTRFLLLQPLGPPSVMGVRFRPIGAYRFMPFPLAEVTDQIVETADVWQKEGVSIEDAVFNARDDSDRIQLVETFLLRRLHNSTHRPRFEAAVSATLRACGQARVDELASHVGLSTRQLEREFQSGLGLSPKAFARIIRFQNLLRVVGEGPLREWVQVALSVGYSDQPHMVREFREFTGRTPSQVEVDAFGALSKHFISSGRLARMLS